MNTYFNNVIKSVTWEQFAWVKNLSETKRNIFSSNCIFSNNIKFDPWLVGVTDGDGTFYFAKTKKGNWTFSFQINQKEL